MLESILSGCPDTPKPGLVYANNALLAAAKNAGAASQTQCHSYFTFVDPKNQLSDIVLSPTVTGPIEQAINAVQGGLKGPAQNAKGMLTEYVKLAIREQYRLDVPAVQTAMGHFLLAVATEGFVETDTTGTQMGNFLGSWRGGGFN